ncbi:alpha/beta hydrolase, partial [Candidatus Woesearchaeota archaeon]|nr:alpha/beta hydrolase [Candidatus Woesearchaeota archaeon]
MNTAVLIHRWDGNPGADWYPWLKKELEMKNFKVIVPSMPNTTEPKIEEWVSHLKKIVPNPDKNTYFIGHSMGCQTIMRYLETLPHVKVGGIIFVAGWFYLKNLENDEVEQIAKPWLTTPIALSKIEGITNKITVFLSTN